MKINDIVICINPRDGLSHGKSYKILDIIGIGFITIIDDKFRKWSYSDHRFEVVLSKSRAERINNISW